MTRAILEVAKTALLAAGILLACPPVAPAQTAMKCELCNKLFATDGRSIRDSVRDRDRVTCLKCSELPTRCSACDLPVPEKNPLKIPDGRVYCALDAPTLVLEQREADRQFHEVKRDVFRLLAEWPPLPDASVTFSLVDKDEFLRQFARFPSSHDPQQVLGLTRSFQSRDGKLTHSIFVLNGLTPGQFAATAAHELAHAWQNDHASKERQLHGDTVEGFCELVAWLVMDDRRAATDKKRIEANSYTRGQLRTLLGAQQEYRFYRVVEWMTNGLDAWLDPQRQERVLVLRDLTPATPAPAPTTVAARAVSTPPPIPTQLELKGILGAPNRPRLALINGGTFAQGDKLELRLGEGRVQVKCVEIRADSVLLAVGEPGERQELFLKTR